MPEPTATPGTSTALTVESAVDALLPLLSDEPEDQQPSDAPREDETEVEETEEQPAESEEVDESEPVDQHEDESEPDESDDQPAPEPRTFRVKVDGQELEVPEEELVRGYSRTADYTRKTQALAAERQAFAAEQARVAQERQRYATALPQLEEFLTNELGPEPDWNALRATRSPEEYQALWIEREQARRQLDAVKAERARVETQVRQDAETAYRRHLAEEQQKLLEAIPAWKDESVRKTESKELVDYAASLGYAPEEIAQVSDHRVIKMLRDAVAGRKATAVKAKAAPVIQQKIEKAKVVAKPGTPQKRAVSELTRRKQALAKTGRIADAAAAIALMPDFE